MVLTLSRGGFCPKDCRQMEGLGGRVPAKPTPANERAPGHYRFASNGGVVFGRRSASVPERNRRC